MKRLTKSIIITFFVFGILFFTMLVLAFTSAPFYMHYNLGQDPNDDVEVSNPQLVMMFGGAGMPSEDNLMRLYHTAALARHFDVPVLLVHPEDSLCQAEMTRLLRQGGIDSILYMTEGANTRSQAVELMNAYPELSERTHCRHFARACQTYGEMSQQSGIPKHHRQSGLPRHR